MTDSTERAADAERRPNLSVDKLPDCMLPDGADPCGGYDALCDKACAVEIALDTALRDAGELRAEVRRLRADIGELLALPADDDGGLWRHKARGTTYRMIGVGRVQCPADAPLHDDELPLVYQDIESGALGIRRSPEFHDGRFERVDPDTKALRHPLTGDTVVVSTETGRILETRPAASGEDAERLARLLRQWAQTFIDPPSEIVFPEHDGHWTKALPLVMQEAAAALGAAHRSDRAEMREIDEPVIEAASILGKAEGPNELLHARVLFRHALATRDAALKALPEEPR